MKFGQQPLLLSLLVVGPLVLLFLVAACFLPTGRGPSEISSNYNSVLINNDSILSPAVEGIKTNPALLIAGAGDGKQQQQQRQLQGSGLWSAMGQQIVGDAVGDAFSTARDISSDGTTIVGCAEVGEYCKVFTYNGSVYVQKGNTINRPVASEKFGSTEVAVSSNGQRIAVGARSADTGGFTNNGCVYVYDFDGTTWQLTGTLSGNASNQATGKEVEMSSDGTVIAASRGQAETAHVFKEVNSVWTRTATFTFSGGNYGTSLSLNAAGDTLAVGSPAQNSNQGEVYVYKNTGGTWSWIVQSKAHTQEHFLEKTLAFLPMG